MIRLEHVTKYYNRHKKNQIAVCDDISLTIDKTGLVVIIGASGSGKTTLLNVISGMDKFDTGRLIFDDVVIDKYKHKKWDSIRKKNIGYVYQNYHLLKSITVYQNIEFVLRMQGFKNDEIIRNHVDRLLKAVGLENYSDRYVKQLSGGEQQRVAFARALANDPEVILADEPTGNLDGRTTIEIMNVIKKISKTRLVIMVTHEKTLSDYFADRVIKIDKGKVIEDYVNDPEHRLELPQEHIITLSEFKRSNIDTDHLNINRYTNNKTPDKLNIDLIERNQTLYVKIDSSTLKRTKYIDSDSEIMIQDQPKDDYVEENPFMLEDIYPENGSDNNRKVFRVKDIFRYALRKLNFSKGGTLIWFLVLFVVGAIISVSVGLIGEIYHVEAPYKTLDPHYITVNLDRSQYYDYADIENVAGVEQLMLVSKPYSFTVATPSYYEITSSIQVSAQPIDIKFFDESILIYGEMPEDYGIIVDQTVADEMIRLNRDKGILDYNDVLNCRFKLQGSAYDTNVGADTALYFDITGIANGNSKSVWMREDLLYSIVTTALIDYHILGDHLNIINGELPDNVKFIMLNEYYPAVVSGEGLPYTVGVGFGNYYISGIYQYVVDDLSYNLKDLVIAYSTDLIKIKYYVSTYHPSTDFKLLVYSYDVKSTLTALADAGFDASAYVYNPASSLSAKISGNAAYLAIALTGILMSAVSIYFVMRSSLISRTYEVSVYRAIGISRKEIRRIFLMEILITTTFSSVLGFFMMILLLIQAQTTVQQISVTQFSLTSILIAIGGMYVINILFGLIPVNRLLRKTPATIMKQSDL